MRIVEKMTLTFSSEISEIAQPKIKSFTGYPTQEMYVKISCESDSRNIWKLKTTIYSLTDASGAWCLRVKECALWSNAYSPLCFFKA